MSCLEKISAKVETHGPGEACLGVKGRVGRGETEMDERGWKDVTCMLANISVPGVLKLQMPGSLLISFYSSKEKEIDDTCS